MDESAFVFRSLQLFGDEKYAVFMRRLLPNLKKEIIGVRSPLIRRLARRMDEGERSLFLENLPHRFYDEDFLHAVLISSEKDKEKCFSEVEKFLPYINNWAVCDSLSPKVFRFHRDEVLRKAKEWKRAENAYACRFAIKMLKDHFLGEDFSLSILQEASSVHRDEECVKLMKAWFFAEALAKHEGEALEYFEGEKLDEETRNLAIRKARESLKISKEMKEYLRSLRNVSR